MKTRYIPIVLILAALFLSGLGPAMAQAKTLTGYEIMDRTLNRPEGYDRKGLITLTLTNKRGAQKAYKFEYSIKDYGPDKKHLLYFMAPENVKGTQFLEYDYSDPGKEDDRWLFLPAMAMDKRIRGESDERSFMGSDFTYEEMGWRSVDEDTHKLLGEEKVDDSLCWVVESIPKKHISTIGKWVSYVSQENYVQLRVLYYNQKGKLFKRLTLGNIKKTDGFWTAYSTLLENLETSHKSTYDLHRIDYNTGLPDEMFRVENLKGHSIKLPPKTD